MSTPWWGGPLIGGGFTVLGLAVGQASALLGERRKLRGERSQRFEREVVGLCVTYLKAVDEVAAKVRTMSVAEWHAWNFMAGLRDLLLQMEIKAPRDVYDTGYYLLFCMQAQVGVDDPREPRNEERAKAGVDGWRYYRTEFLRAIRENLGLLLDDTIYDHSRMLGGGGRQARKSAKRALKWSRLPPPMYQHDPKKVL